MLQRHTLWTELGFGRRAARDEFVVCDLPGFAEFADKAPRQARQTRKTDWYGGMTFDQSLAAVRNGDMAGVPASDEMLKAMDKLAPASHAWRVVDSVVGAMPNVPQYLAGNPYNMRLRRRTIKDTAPLAIFVELVASAGINADTCRKRGAAMLALTRALTNTRPVELWAVIATGESGRRTSICIRLDTAPLDLARAAHVLTHPSVFRALGYETLNYSHYSGSWNGSWAFGSHADHVRTAADSYRRVLHPGSDVLFVPPVHLSDQYLTNPQEWMRTMLAAHGGLDAAA